MNCPYCGKEMRFGYIESRDGLGWNKKKVLLKAFAFFSSEIPLGQSVEAYNCGDCKKIVLAYD